MFSIFRKKVKFLKIKKLVKDAQIPTKGTHILPETWIKAGTKLSDEMPHKYVVIWTLSI